MHMVSPKFLSNICAAVKSCSDAKKDKLTRLRYFYCLDLTMKDTKALLAVKNVSNSQQSHHDKLLIRYYTCPVGTQKKL